MDILQRKLFSSRPASEQKHTFGPIGSNFDIDIPKHSVLKRLFTFLIILFCCLGATHAQQHLPCGSTQAWNEMVTRHPEAQQAHDALDQWTRQYLENAAARGVADDDSVLIIPMVVHVMHNFGAENVSQAQVEDAVRVINEDYAKRSRDVGQISATFAPIAARVRFEFRLARIDPQGNCTIGVTRTVTNLTAAGDDQVKGLVRWPNSKYLNVWIVNNIASGAGAYAYYPDAPAAIDGIVCRASQFGSIGASGGSNGAVRTLTHELGHYFNLPHTWGSSNEPGLASNCNIDDGVADTPNTRGTANSTCNLNQNTCGAALPDNVENYMDYSSCGRMFTLGQKARMRAAAYGSASSRSNLWSINNLIATGTLTVTPSPVCAPKIVLPNFSFKVCPGQNVRYVVSVDNAPASTVNFRWEFPGSSTPVSIDAYPQVTYVTPGIYGIKLTISNAAGTDSVSVDSSILVRNPNGLYAPGDSETFASPTWPSVSDTAFHRWEFENSDTRQGWVRNAAVGSDGSNSLHANLRILNVDQTYSALTPAFDLRSLSGQAYLVFRYASAKRVNSARDEFKVYASSNCGTNWNIVGSRTSTSVPSVYTHPANILNSAYVPQPSDFVEQRMNVRNYLGRNNIRFKFEVSVAGGGNAIFIDQVKVIAAPVGVDERYLLNDVEIAPNPSSTLVEVALPSWPETKPVRYELISPLGQRVKAGRSDGNRFSMDVSALSAGVYMLQLEGQKMQRLIVE